MADISSLRKSISEMSTEELEELIGGTRNARLEAIKPKKRTKSTKPRATKSKQLSLADLMAKIDTMTPEEAAEAFARLNGESEEESEEDDDEEDITAIVCYEMGYSYRERNPNTRVNLLMKSDSKRWRTWIQGWEAANSQLIDNSWRTSLIVS